MQTDGTWRDATSYSQGDLVKDTAPRTWKLEIGKVSITVTKHIHYGDEWTIFSPDLGIQQTGLGTTDVTEAKSNATKMALKLCQERIDSYTKMMSKLKDLSDD